VLVSWASGSKYDGEILLYNADTGEFLESIGTIGSPALTSCYPKYLDTDDGNWEIHVSSLDGSGNPRVSVFSYI